MGCRFMAAHVFYLLKCLKELMDLIVWYSSYIIATGICGENEAGQVLKRYLSGSNSLR